MGTSSRAVSSLISLGSNVSGLTSNPPSSCNVKSLPQGVEFHCREMVSGAFPRFSTNIQAAAASPGIPIPSEFAVPSAPLSESPRVRSASMARIAVCVIFESESNIIIISTNPASVPNASAGAVTRRVGLHVAPTSICTPDDAPGSRSVMVQLAGNPASSMVIDQVPASRPVEVMRGCTSSSPPGRTLTGSVGTPIETLYGAMMFNTVVVMSLSVRVCVTFPCSSSFSSNMCSPNPPDQSNENDAKFPSPVGETGSSTPSL